MPATNKMNARTLQERLGFRDNDLATPEHDQLMMWLDENMQIVLDTYCHQDGTSAKEISDEIRWAKQRGYTIEGDIPALPFRPTVIKQKKWELPVMSNQYLIGFIDLAVRFEITKVGLSVNDGQRTAQWGVWTNNYAVAFEVKSYIPSIGEVIRQVRTYQQYEPSLSYHEIDRFFVVSPDHSFAKVLEAQGIGFIPAPML